MMKYRVLEVEYGFAGILLVVLGYLAPMSGLQVMLELETGRIQLSCDCPASAGNGESVRPLR